MSEALLIFVSLSSVIAFFTAVIFFILEQQRLLENIRPQSRMISPGKVWLQLIPLYGMIFEFRLVARIADSIRNELSAPSENDWLSAEQFSVTDRPTYSIGLTCAVLSCCSLLKIPILQALIGIATLICWIMYWLELRKYHQQIKQRLAEVPVE